MKNEQIPSESVMDRLDLPTRNRLQIEVIKMMLADGTLKTEMDWIKHPYSKIVSDVIDFPENFQIRNLALSGDFTKAAELLEPLLIEREKKENHKIAA